MYYSKRNKIIIYFLFIQTAEETHSERKSKTEREKNNSKIEQKLNIAANQFIHTHTRVHIYRIDIYIMMMIK